MTNVLRPAGNAVRGLRERRPRTRARGRTETRNRSRPVGPVEHGLDKWLVAGLSRDGSKVIQANIVHWNKDRARMWESAGHSWV